MLPPTAVALGSATWTQLASSATHTCAVALVGDVQQLYCWGQNDLGEVTGDPNSSACPDGICATPQPAPTMSTRVYTLVVGNGFTCIQGDDEVVSCWGDDRYGQLGDGSGSAAHGPSSPGTYPLLYGGGYGACAGDLDEAPSCWGWYQPAEAGTVYPTPVTFTGLGDIGPIAFEIDSTCAAIGSGVSCWGYNFAGQLGEEGSGAPVDTPTPIDPTFSPMAPPVLGGAVQHYCALDNNGSVFCWGTDYDGETGVPQQGDYVYSPERIAPAEGVLNNCSSLAIGDVFGCAGCSNGVWCWGMQTLGQTGQVDANGNVNQLMTLMEQAILVTSQPPGGVAGGGSNVDDHACTIPPDGVVGPITCWGMGPRGELGVGSDVHGSPSPVVVAVP
jgi:alpha-tubulin suppressor-like RCC1 family protein